MSVFYWMVFLALVGALFTVGAVAADAAHGGRPVTGRRLILSGATGGAISTGALGILVAIVPEGNLPAIPVAVAVGMLVGGGIGALSALTHRRCGRHLDRTA
jgi:ABC-type Fe3+-siderophore transport system permease subunit